MLKLKTYICLIFSFLISLSISASRAEEEQFAHFLLGLERVAHAQQSEEFT